MGWSAIQTVRRARGVPQAVAVVEREEEVVAAAVLRVERFAPLPVSVAVGPRSSKLGQGGAQ